MARSERLLELLQTLRRHRRPVSGAALAAEAGISLRTLYRDIDSLRAQGAVIEGEAGVGYVLKPGYLLPPLMFSDEEVEALVLGSRWVARRTDEPLAAAAREALAKIGAVLPPALAERIEMSALFVGPSRTPHADLAPIRQAIRNERKLAIRYDDGRGAVSERIIWPLALAFFDGARIVVSWCELRQDFRHFRTDRIVALTATDTRYPRRRPALLSEWRRANGIAPQE